MSDGPYELIIGLEVHVQLATRSKLFCRCSTQFGAAPNTQTCPVCIGLPGALPVMNREAYQLSLRTALALNCEIPRFTKWDRKNYYYPDLPKGYQISQFDLPMSQHGWLEIHDAKGEFEPKKIRITRAHLEEDAGKSMHDELAGKADSRIDLNRTGTPLLEIVSEPDLRSPKEAKAYLTELRLLLLYLGVSDCNMQEGSLRVDANVNLHIPTADGTIATPIVEVKNVNSFRAVERALAYEATRQYEAWLETGLKKGEAPKQTRGWDDQRQVTYGQRHKEESSDYRYFPDPDLAPVVVTDEQIERVRAGLGELPAQLRQRLQAQYRLTAYDADVIVNQEPAFAAYYLAVADAVGDGKLASNWVTQETLRLMNERGESVDQFPVSAAAMAELLTGIKAGRVPGPRAKEVFAVMVDQRLSVAQTLDRLGIAAVSGEEIESLCRQLLADNPRVVADVAAGKVQAVASLIGQAKKRNPNVNPNDVRETCLRIIQQSSSS
ncbi:MAG: Asp-tRNA(Asn)/Glu-tRNA(Gln) amidotransferase subunit GatB [Pirellulales bacterium]